MVEPESMDLEFENELVEEFTYRFDEKSDSHIITIYKKEYVFDTKDRYFCEMLENHTNMMDVLFNLSDAPFRFILKERDSDQAKAVELKKFADYRNYTALESYLDHIKLLLEFRKSNPTKLEKDLLPNDSIEKCCICMCELYDQIYDYTFNKIEEQLKTPSDEDVIYLSKCQGHSFHKACILSYLKTQNMSFMKCPVCSKIYGIIKGDLPDGDMVVSVNPSLKCSGYKCGSIVIVYSMKGGKKNGIPFFATSRTAYLPDNKEGQEVLKLLKTAFDRRLIFTVGDSITSGAKNVIVWNGIHHKTSPSGGTSNYGYPDPTYFSRVKEELAAKGVI